MNVEHRLVLVFESTVIAFISAVLPVIALLAFPSIVRSVPLTTSDVAFPTTIFPSDLDSTAMLTSSCSTVLVDACQNVFVGTHRVTVTQRPETTHGLCALLMYVPEMTKTMAVRT